MENSRDLDSEIWRDPFVIMMLFFAALVAILAIILFVVYCICDVSTL